MRIALTIWEDRISPVFDASSMILLAEIHHGRVLNRRLVAFNPGLLQSLAEMLRDMQVSVFVCGAIVKESAEVITAGGIELIPFISGETEKILGAFAQGTPIIRSFAMPGTGARCRRGWHRRTCERQTPKGKN